MLNTLLASCSELSRISSAAAEAWAQASDNLLEHVNNQLALNPKIKELIGRNPLDLFHNNHKNHAMLMTTVFRANSFELLVRTTPWVYRSYHSRGFSYDYFLVELIAWQIAIRECLDSQNHKDEILTVYKWLIQHHEQMIQLSLTGEGLSFSVHREADAMQEIFLSLLLHGDSHGCCKLAEQSIQSADELKHFYLDIVWPAMYRIGLLWESNQITVAEEHLATAIVGRVMAELYPRFAQYTITRGKVIVSAGPNEFHWVGARMVADFMEMAGWDVTFLGANTPADALLDILKRQQPFMVALSVATVFNLDNAQKVIRMIKEDHEISNIKVLVGGLAFNSMPELWQNIGADGYAADAGSLIPLSDEWWLARNE